MAIELKVPSFGESITEVVVGPWLKSVGDQVQQDENIVELESDKATFELPATSAGVITKILKQTGETVAVGDVIGYLDESGSAPSEASSQSSISSAKRAPGGNHPPEPAEPAEAAPESDGATGQAGQAAGPARVKSEPVSASPQPAPASSQSKPAESGKIRANKPPRPDSATPDVAHPDRPVATSPKHVESVVSAPGASSFVRKPSSP